MSNDTSRRQFLTGTVAAATASAVPSTALGFDFDSFMQKHFRQMSDEELDAACTRLARQYSEKYGKEFTVKGTAPYDDCLFGYGLDITRCIGCRRCVYGCVEENNQSRDPEIHWIRVLEFERESLLRGFDLSEGNAYYDHAEVPASNKIYLPTACMHCQNSPCTNVCPTGATWRSTDGIVLIDYDWCIGCRYCMAACPYGARHFNWTEPTIPADEVNTNCHIVGNRPRKQGVVEKCHWCTHRTREGLYPKCVEVCPVGARKFGNMLDPDSEIRAIMRTKRTFVLKSELGTLPKFFYFLGGAERGQEEAP